MLCTKQLATVFRCWRDMPVSKHLVSAGSPQAKRCSNLVRLTEELDRPLGAFRQGVLSVRF